jgi:hypothetical protein
MRRVFSVIVLWVFCVTVLKFSALYLHKNDLANASDYVFMGGAVLLLGSLVVRGLREYNMSQRISRAMSVSYTAATPKETKV